MFKNYYLFSYYNKTKFDKKINKNNENTFNMSNYIYNLELILKIPSSIENKQKFIIMMILMDKYLNNQLTFLLDTKTINKSKAIKIGCIINLTNEMLNTFLNMNNSHNIYKFYDNEIMFNFNKSKLIRYEVKKILSNLVFHFDNNINYYYDYLNEFNYSITFFLKSIFNNTWYNRLFLTQRGYYFFNFSHLNFKFIIKQSWYDIILEEQNNVNIKIEKLSKKDIFFLSKKTEINVAKKNNKLKKN